MMCNYKLHVSLSQRRCKPWPRAPASQAAKLVLCSTIVRTNMPAAQRGWGMSVYTSTCRRMWADRHVTEEQVAIHCGGSSPA